MTERKNSDEQSSHRDPELDPLLAEITAELRVPVEAGEELEDRVMQDVRAAAHTPRTQKKGGK